MELLPPKHLLLDACRGLPHGAHPVLHFAGRLAELHEQRLAAGPDTTADIDHQRAQLVHDIDRWVATELPSAAGGAHMHTETIGTVVDRLAQFSALAYLTLVSSPDWPVHHAWERLWDLAIGYEHLADEVGAGLRRLPNLSGHHEH